MYEGNAKTITSPFTNGAQVNNLPRVSMLEENATDIQNQAKRIWDSVYTLKNHADNIFGAVPEPENSAKVAHSPTSKLGQLHEAQQNLGAAVTALNDQVARFAAL